MWLYTNHCSVVKYWSLCWNEIISWGASPGQPGRWAGGDLSWLIVLPSYAHSVDSTRSPIQSPSQGAALSELISGPSTDGDVSALRCHTFTFLLATDWVKITHTSPSDRGRQSSVYPRSVSAFHHKGKKKIFSFSSSNLLDVQKRSPLPIIHFFTTDWPQMTVFQLAGCSLMAVWMFMLCWHWWFAFLVFLL